MTRRHDSKISAIFWGLVYLLPFIIFFCGFLAYFQPFADSVQSVDFDTFSFWLFDFVNDLRLPTIISDSFMSFLNLFVDFNSGVEILGVAFAQFMFNILVYYIFVHIFRLAVDVLLFIPHLFHSWISKFDRKVE